MFTSLRSSVSLLVGRSLSPAESRELALEVCACQAPLLSLWVDTLHVSATGRRNAGRLQPAWRREQAEREVRNAELRSTGALPRYEPGARVIVAAEEHCSLSREGLARLAANINVRLIDDYAPSTATAAGAPQRLRAMDAVSTATT
eukprot:TRINITY_DN9987_c0_g1_i2.p1 TRINITY_DN9987_c0_g1~~TRINITY_DN9987_c0_g1_i2.p1  ORF type:complete len:146 (-),score=31.13 TRINITY_DN9987_c0_g1_i2:41-478(-)